DRAAAAREGSLQLSRGHVPQQDKTGLIEFEAWVLVYHDGGQSLAVGAEHRCFALENGPLRAADHVPQPHHLPKTAAGQDLAVGGKDQEFLLLAGGYWGQLLAAGQVPEPNLAEVGHGQEPAVRAERLGMLISGVPNYSAVLPRGRVPQP